MRSKRAVVASFVSASGGVGKTKLSLMLAYYLSKNNKQRVLFIDLDPTAGASLAVFSEEEYDELVRNRSTLSDALEQYLVQRAIVEPSSVIKPVKVGDAFIDFVAPGEKMIRVVDELWRSSSAGLRFKRALESFTPFTKYDCILVANAPFFDPRYTALSLHISDCLFIPLRPSLIDLRRTLRMVFWLEEEVTTTEGGEKLRENIYAVFNQVPYHKEQVEGRFVENFLRGGKEKRFGRPELFKRYSALLTHSEQLRRKGVKFMDAYIELASSIERFPATTKLPAEAEKFVKGAASLLEGVLASLT